MEHPAPTSAAPARELAPRLVSVATFAVLALIGTVAVPAVGLAQPSCTRDVETWGQSCADRTGISLTVRFCDVDAIVLRAGTEGFEEHDYEIRGNPEGMFRDVGGIGLAPIGSFVWDEAPPGMHQTFDALVECLEHGVPEAASFRGVQSPPGRLWLLPLALVLVAFVFERRRRGAHVHWRVGATLGGIVVATLFARVALVGFGFFHQNGQGPMWVDYALCHASLYGAGYYEVFGVSASLGGHSPELGIFWWNALLVATIPATVWLMARAIGADPKLAAACALIVALDPAAARVGGSESYYGATAALLCLATATLAWGARMARRRDPVFLAAVAATGLVVALAVRVHPVTWPAALFVPGVLLFTPGPLRARIVRTCAAVAGIAVVVLVVAGPSLAETATGAVGDQWFARREDAPPLPFELLGIGGALLVAGLAWRRGRQPLLGLALFLGAVATLTIATGLHNWTPYVLAGLQRLYIAPIAVGALALLSPLARRKRGDAMGAIVLVIVACVWFSSNAGAWLLRPTDGLELDLAREWRDEIPSDSTVAHLWRAGNWILDLPLSDCVPSHPTNVAFMVGDQTPNLATIEGPTFLYIGALCSVEPGDAVCEAARARFPLETFVEYELPAVPSLGHLQYPDPSVTVGLYRVVRDDD